MIKRKLTRPVMVGNVQVGGGAPVSVQSMTNTDTRDVDRSVAQIIRLEQAGCQIVRLAIPDEAAARALAEIRRQVSVPLVADIHFDYRLALLSLEAGVDKLRLNPGNIGSAERVRCVVDAAKERKVPIRIGVNAGSLSETVRARYGGATPEAMVESAMEHVHILEDEGFEDIIIAIKASSVEKTIDCYRMISEKVSYPLHIGVTEAGSARMGLIKSAVGIGTLLAEGIGDTLRVSLTGDPEQEVDAGRDILRSLGLLKEGVEIVSCPTCGRTQIDLLHIAQQVQERTKHIREPLKIAVMGCVVNGPGEARDADLGLAGGKGAGVIFRKGEKLRVCPEEQLVDALMEEVDKLCAERSKA